MPHRGSTPNHTLLYNYFDALRPHKNLANITFLQIYVVVINGAGDKPMVEVRIGSENKQFAPEEISAMVSLFAEDIVDK
jgi:hypothetical protein